MAPTADQATISKLVYGALSDSRLAYRPRPADQALSEDIFRRFLEALDGNKQFFTAADIARFEPYRGTMGEAVRQATRPPRSPCSASTGSASTSAWISRASC